MNHNEPDVKLLILFGSRARGTQGRISDTDVAVLADRPLTVRDKGVIAEQVAPTLHVSEDEIDIVDLQSASPLLQYHVAEEGKLLRGNTFDFTRFKVLAWKRYLDTARFRKARHESLKRHVARIH
ncbi:MAG: hypothetical protein G01um101429_1048 [Parcubacteria group bacterium Gr01-1014_29]|nr:MAG: hypothetical protein G01um101429_1048 [Parcubacteria group bacterium Gr01-1014_29]